MKQYRVMIIDETAQAEHLRVLTAALWYRSRAIPLAWVCWPGQTKQAVSYWNRCGHVLDQAAQVLPADARVVVAADRAFGCPVFTDQVAVHGWDWLVRVQGQTRWRDRQGRIQPMIQQVAQRGDRWKVQGEVFKDAGWRSARLVALWGLARQKPLLLVSNLPLSWELIAIYRQRAAIEALFRDWKSSRWRWESSQVRDLTHQEHLVAGLGLATLITLVLAHRRQKPNAAVPPAVTAANRGVAARVCSRWIVRPSGNGCGGGIAPPSDGISPTWMGAIGRPSSVPGTP